MSTPGFSADACLRNRTGQYRVGRSGRSRDGSVVPAIPFCGNCDYILENCERNNWRPRALCRACLTGNCFSGVEDPTPSDPWTPLPGSQFPGL
jgi:hypothetical protein